MGSTSRLWTQYETERQTKGKFENLGCRRTSQKAHIARIGLIKWTKLTFILAKWIVDLIQFIKFRIRLNFGKFRTSHSKGIVRKKIRIGVTLFFRDIAVTGMVQKQAQKTKNINAKRGFRIKQKNIHRKNRHTHQGKFLCHNYNRISRVSPIQSCKSTSG